MGKLFAAHERVLTDPPHLFPGSPHWVILQGATPWVGHGLCVPDVPSALPPEAAWGTGLLAPGNLRSPYTPLYAQAISSTVRDATYVLDGLLHHQTHLEIEEHYTDTSGYTDHIFALCHLLGFRFAPRIRDLADHRLFSFEKPSQYADLKPLLGGRIQTRTIREHWDEIARLITSLRQGTVSPSLLVSKLAGHPGSVAKFDFGLAPHRDDFAKAPTIGPFSRNKTTASCFTSKLRNRTLGTAACIDVMNHAPIQAVPRKVGSLNKNEVIIQKAHRYGYDHAIENCGIRLQNPTSGDTLVFPSTFRPCAPFLSSSCFLAVWYCFSVRRRLRLRLF